MTRQLVFGEGLDVHIRPVAARTQPDSSKIGKNRIRLRRGKAISWSFRPIGSAFDTSATRTGIPDQLLSTALIVWIDSDDGTPNAGLTMPTEHCDANWLYLQLNDGVSSSNIAMLSKVLVELREIICLLGDTYSISRNHVYLASMGSSAVVALRLLLIQPEEFLGIALFNADFEAMPTLIDADDRVTHARALLAASVQRASAIREALSAGRLLHAIGMSIKTLFYLPGPLTPVSLFGELAEWINCGRLVDGDLRCQATTGTSQTYR